MTPGDIMIVDDNPANLKLLEDMLRQKGHEVRSFPLGRLALAAARKSLPDLILLDINMPEMNGYQVCGQLKCDRTLADIPVIFLSALNETQDKVKAFQTGAVDYISKPFQFEEVHARVETHLKLHQLQQALKRQNESLEEAVAARTRELAEANCRLTILDRSKGEFLNLISHEFRTPLNGLLGVGEIILEEMSSVEGNDELREIFRQSRQRILSILDDALLLTQIDVNGDQFKLAPVCLHGSLQRALEQAALFAASRRVEFSRPSRDLGLVLANEDLLVRALCALVDTAVRFSQEGETVHFAHETTPGAVKIILEGYGRAIPDPVLPNFFDVFSVGEAGTPARDLGLGPAVAFRILALFGASVSVKNLDSLGIRLSVSLKAAD